MPSENDVPLGEGARRYYEQQFGDRIRQVSKTGGVPKNSGGSNWSGKAGAGAVIGVVFVIIRIIIAVARTDSSTPSYTYTPPAPPKFEMNFQKELDDAILQVDANFTDEDVPFPQGLCYRILQESRQQQATPGKRIFALATADQRQQIAKAATEQKLSEKEQSDLRTTLNAILRRADFYDDDSFVFVPGKFNLIVAQAVDRGDAAPKDPLFNRLLLEKCYPLQIVSLSQRGKLDAAAREEWQREARLDLASAQRSYEPAKH